MDWNDSDLLIAKTFCKYYGFAYYSEILGEIHKLYFHSRKCIW